MTLKDIFTYLMILTLFSGAFVLGNSGFDFYLCYVIFIAFICVYLLCVGSIHVHKGFFILFLYFAVTSLLCVIAFRYSYYLLIKQMFGIAFSSLAYYLLIKTNDYDVEKLFKLYLRVALIIATLGLVQEISFFLGFTPGYDWSYFIPNTYFIADSGQFYYRVNSIMPEPSMLAIVLAPAMLIALNNLFLKTKCYLSQSQSLLILLAFFLTFSSVAYLGFVFAFVILLQRSGYLNIKKKKIIFLPIIIVIISFVLLQMYNAIPDLRKRVNSALALTSTSGQIYDFSFKMDRNVSVLIFYSQLNATVYSVRKSPFFGTGLGTHAENFNNCFQSFINASSVSGQLKMLRGWGFGVNMEDANSLFLRLLSETGIIGLVIILWLIKKYYIAYTKISGNDPSQSIQLCHISMINNAMFLLILLRLIRFGHYFIDGLFFFAFLYYYSSKAYKGKQDHILELGCK